VLEEAMIVRGRGPLQPEDLALDPVDTVGDGAPRTARRPAFPPRSQAARREAVALDLARDRGAVTRGALVAAGGISGELARQTLGALVGLGRLRRLGAGRRTRYVRA
jgi:hypothetical protein